MKPLPFTVVTTVALPERHARRLRASFREVLFTEDFSRADGVFCTLRDRMDAARIAAAPRLKVISLMAVGHDSVDVAAAGKRGIVVTNTPGVLTEATADLTLGLLIAVARRIVEGDRDVRAGRFAGWSPFDYLGPDVHGATLGIVGAGRIGRAVARRARGFGMKVIFADRRRSGLKRLLRRADFVSLHCPLAKATFHLIGADELALMKPTAVLINTARGPVVDEQALVRALRDGQIAGAGLDVYEREPDVTPDLLAMDNVVLLPHLASASLGARHAMASLAIDNLIAALAGRRPRHAVT